MSEEQPEDQKEITPNKQRSKSNPGRGSNAPSKNRQNEKFDDGDRSADVEEEKKVKWNTSDVISYIQDYYTFDMVFGEVGQYHVPPEQDTDYHFSEM